MTVQISNCLTFKNFFINDLFFDTVLKINKGAERLVITNAVKYVKLT